MIVNLFADQAWLIDRDAPDLLKFHQDSGFTYEVTDLPKHDGVDIAKVAVYRRSRRSRAGRGQSGARIRRRAVRDLFAAGLSRGDDVERIEGPRFADRARAPRRRRLACVAFGDNMNDIDLLETAGHPFMMNNANPDLITRLPNVPRIGNNFEAGVAHHLRKLFALDDELTS